MRNVKLSRKSLLCESQKPKKKFSKAINLEPLMMAVDAKSLEQIEMRNRVDVSRCCRLHNSKELKCHRDELENS